VTKDFQNVTLAPTPMSVYFVHLPSTTDLCVSIAGTVNLQADLTFQTTKQQINCWASCWHMGTMRVQMSVPSSHGIKSPIKNLHNQTQKSKGLSSDRLMSRILEEVDKTSHAMTLQNENELVNAKKLQTSRKLEKANDLQKQQGAAKADHGTEDDGSGGGCG
jgi:hypothetical protein